MSSQTTHEDILALARRMDTAAEFESWSRELTVEPSWRLALLLAEKEPPLFSRLYRLEWPDFIPPTHPFSRHVLSWLRRSGEDEEVDGGDAGDDGDDGDAGAEGAEGDGRPGASASGMDWRLLKAAVLFVSEVGPKAADYPYGVKVAAFKLKSAVSKLSSLLQGEYRTEMKKGPTAAAFIRDFLPWAVFYGGLSGDVAKKKSWVVHCCDFLASNSEAEGVAESEKSSFLPQLPTLPELPTRDEVSKALSVLDSLLSAWDESLARAGKSSSGKNDVALVAELQDGYVLYRVTSPAGLDYEGAMLGHCVGQGSYDRFVGKSHGGSKAQTGIYSVRKDLLPYATLQIDNGAVLQVKGPKNSVVHPEAVPAVLDALVRLGCEVTSDEDMETCLGYIPMIQLDLFTGLHVTVRNKKYISLEHARLNPGAVVEQKAASRVLRVLVKCKNVSDQDLSLLVSMGADVADYGNQAVKSAAAYGRTETVRTLAQVYGANVKAGQNFAIRQAAKNGHTETVRLLASLGADCTDVHEDAVRWAAENGHADTVRLLAELGSDVTGGQNDAMRGAAKNGHTETVRLLASLGADVQAMENQPVRFAAAYGHTETVRLLAELGADVKAGGNATVRCAAENGHTETVQLLASLGADVKAWDNYTLRLAASNGHTETVQLLESLGAKIPHTSSLD